jgi:hypothetical protein
VVGDVLLAVSEIGVDANDQFIVTGYGTAGTNDMLKL